MSQKIKCALIGPGNIGTDLLYKLRRSPVLDPVWMVGIDPESEGLKRAAELGLKTTADGVDGLLPHVLADGVQIAFDATSAYVHAENTCKLNALGGANGITLVPYFDDHPSIGVDADARNPVHLAIDERPGEWSVRQTLCDPEGDHDWVLTATVDLARSDAEGEAVVRMTAVQRLDP